MKNAPFRTDTANEAIQLWIIVCVTSGVIVCGMCIVASLVDVALYYYRNTNTIEGQKDDTYKERLMTEPKVVIPFQHVEDEEKGIKTKVSLSTTNFT
jgi:hypothetical protein